MQTCGLQDCRVALINDLPYYGLAIPAGQAVGDGGLILLSSDQQVWSDGLGPFILAHEMAHIMQDAAGLLNVPSMAGVRYAFPSDATSEEHVDLTILTERSADAVATLVCLTHPDAESFSALSAEGSLRGLFAACRDWLNARKSGPCRADVLIDPDQIDQTALRYYASYVRDLSLSGMFNMNAASIRERTVPRICRQARLIEGLAAYIPL